MIDSDIEVEIETRVDSNGQEQPVLVSITGGGIDWDVEAEMDEMHPDWRTWKQVGDTSK